ncbi:SMP-30/gluconolactonase/LRE family protein [Pseudooceanicola nanhaiensis]|uniref:SMP-30/gluconolactonase/LRE family protein n=1 Tax=Pseudooceanicola nanhaiensis TaxID=375761 RepID=UPI001CD5003A|nr:SMP-30/gluconolactonase/LRE family protein [Pseudooceanicola nanhaiensis]MCA0919263.1 SMP-30/gluconolactonase/LRE family protein [Pseudooceanicola nanhaiensis]
MTTHTYPAPEPVILDAEVFTELPPQLRRPGVPSYWAERNRRGQAVDSFVEGPSFDRAGNLYFVDIPFGRVFRASPGGEVTQVAEYEGQPNGLKIHRDGRIFLADYQNGIMLLDPETGAVTPALADCDTEGFKGCNDLHFGRDGTLFFTDQGQTGLHDPTGRVYRWTPDSGRLDCLINTAPSPNGLVLDLAEHVLFLAVTRANAVWRLMLSPSGRVNKAGLFIQFTGGRAGPDGLALTTQGGVVVCQTGMGLVWVHNALGQPIAVVRSLRGLGTTNCAFGGPEGRSLFITESDSGSILKVDFPEELGISGAPMFAHAD